MSLYPLPDPVTRDVVNGAIAPVAIDPSGNVTGVLALTASAVIQTNTAFVLGGGDRTIRNNVSNDAAVFTGGNNATDGGNVYLAGSTAGGGLASIGRLRNGSTVALEWKSGRILLNSVADDGTTQFQVQGGARLTGTLSLPLIEGTGATTGDYVIKTRASGDSQERFGIEATGRMWWGPGNAAVDVNLYRQDSATLRTDDNFRCVGVNFGQDTLTYNQALTTYTPTWTGASVNPSLGNGTLTGRYSRIGKRVTAHVRLTIGSTTTLGTGNWRFALPFANTSALRAHGAVYIFRSGVAYYVATAVVEPSGSLAFVFPNGASDAVGPAIPFAWATGDELSFTLNYDMD